MYKLNKLYAESTLIEKRNGLKIYNSKHNASFGKSIFIRTDAQPDVQKLVLEHEKAHIQQRHTIDRLFANVVQSLSWFNPTVYIWQELMIKNHEFLADEQVLKNTSRKKYSTFLLQQQLQSNQPLAIKPLNHMSHLKNRIMRMKKEK